MPLRKEYRNLMESVSLSLPCVSLSHVPPIPHSFSILSCHSQAQRGEWLGVMTVATSRAGEAWAAEKSTEKREGAVGAPEPHSSPATPLPGALLKAPAFPSQESWLLSPPCVQSYGHNCPAGVEVSTETSLLEGGRR